MCASQADGGGAVRIVRRDADQAAAIGADPQGAIGGAKQIAHRGVLQQRLGHRVSVFATSPPHAIGTAHPEFAIVGMGERVDASAARVARPLLPPHAALAQPGARRGAQP